MISRILITKNEDLLAAIETIFATAQQSEIVSLSSEQIEMLLMSESDIASGNLISEEKLDRLDKQWMK